VKINIDTDAQYAFTRDCSAHRRGASCDEALNRVDLPA
jgi:hypothetical protein